MASKLKMTLYQTPLARSFKALWLIQELGIKDHVQVVTLNPSKKDTEEYKEYVKSVHPHGTIPALVVEKDGEREGVILESTAICLYLADLEGKLAPALNERREYYDWVMYGTCTMEGVLDFLFYQWVMPNFKGEPDVEGVAKNEAKFDICMNRLTAALERSGNYVLGDSFTAADCIVGFCVYSASLDLYKKGRLIERFPSVKAYLSRLMKRSAFNDALEVMGKYQ